MTTVPNEARAPRESNLQRFLWSVGEARRRRRSATAVARLDLRSRRHADHVYLEVVGELGGANARDFSEAVYTLIGPSDHTLVVDLGRAMVFDQAGVSALEGARKLLSRHDGELVLKSPRSETLRLLELAGLGNSFTVC